MAKKRSSDSPTNQTKARLAAAIAQAIRQDGITQVAAAERLGITQPKVSALLNFKLAGFSVERLMSFLNAICCDVEIVIRRKRGRGPGKTSVRSA